MNKKIEWILIIIALCLILQISACAKVEDAPPTEMPPDILNLDEAYPTSLDPLPMAIDEMYPVIFSDTLSDLPQSLTIPDPDADSAVIYGKVLSISAGNAPFLNASLYLGAYLAPNEGGEQAPMLVGISPDIDPKAQQAQDGSFVFVNVPPGSYGLFLYTPMSAFLMTDAKTNDYVNVDVQAGQVIDLGTLYVP